MDNLQTELIRLSSGAKIDDVSTLTDLSDSDMEETPVDDTLVHALNDRPPMMETHLNGNIKNTLIENVDLLSDKNIVDDLLSRQFESAETIFSKIIDPSACNKEVCDNSKVPSSLSFLSVNSTPKKKLLAEPPYENQKENRNQVKKQVKFISPYKDPKPCSHVVSFPKEIDPLYRGMGASYVSHTHLLSKLFDAQPCYDNPYEGTSALQDSHPFNDVLISQLKVQQQRSKELEEDVGLSEASLVKAKRELEILQTRILRKEDQLKEANCRLENIQSEWKIFNKKISLGRDSAKIRIEQLVKKNEDLQIEKDTLEKKLSEISTHLEENSSIQQQMGELQSQLAFYKSSYDQAYTENKHLNEALEATKLKFNSLENDSVPSLRKEVASLKDTTEALQVKREEMIVELSTLKDENRFLTERNKVLLDKVGEEAQSNQQTQKEMGVLKKQLNDVNENIPSMKKEIHDYYQKEMNKILFKQSKELQTALFQSETNLQKKTVDDIEKLKLSHRNELEILENRQMEELESCRSKHREEISYLTKQIESIRHENSLLKNKQKTIVAVIPTPLEGQSQSETEIDPIKEIGMLTRNLTSRDAAQTLVERDLPQRSHQNHDNRHMPKQNHKRSDHYRERQYQAFHISDNSPAQNGFKEQNLPMSRQHHMRTHSSREKFSSRPFATSTSISSIHHTSSSCDEEEWRRRRITSKSRNPVRGVRILSPKKREGADSGFKTAQDIVASSSEGDKAKQIGSNPAEGVLHAIDQEMMRLAMEVHKGGALHLNQTDSQKTFDRLDVVSDMLTKMASQVNLSS